MLRCQAGNADSFVELYNEFAPRTRRFLGGMIGSSDLDDVQQELWIAVFQSIGSLSRPSAFITWLFRLARYKAIDRLRKTRSRQETPYFDDDDHAVALAPIVSGVAIEHDVGNEIDVGRAVLALSPAHRETVLLRYWEGLSYAQIALITDCPLGTVRSRLHHAHNIMRKKLNHSTSESTTT